jgi:tetratricopeptide (TPR) repeat protein
MQNSTQIRIEGDNNIVIHDVQGTEISINTHNTEEIVAVLHRLSDAQLDALTLVAAKETEKISQLFRSLLAGISTQKNIVHGSISNVTGNVHIGDINTTTYNYYPIPVLPKELTSKIPKTSQKQIVGRSEDLKDLHTRLFDNKQVVLVNGLGGIGKTTLAQVYVSEYYEEYKHIVWSSQLSGDFSADLINTEGLLLGLGISTEGKDLPTLFNETLIALKSISDQPNLWVIDNADAGLRDYYDYLPGQPNWHILVTSRERIAHFDLKELDFLSETDAIALFKKHYALSKISDHEILELVKAVDKHTLTIEILAKTAQEQRTPLSRLKKAIEDDLQSGVYIRHKGSEIERVTSYLSSIFSLSQLSPEEIRLMQLMACLPPEYHHFVDLLSWIHADDTLEEDLMAIVINKLVSKGWLLSDPETDSFKMHRILGEITYRQAPPSISDMLGLNNAISDKLDLDQAKDNPVDKFQWIPFGDAILERFKNDSSWEISKLQNNLANVYGDLGRYEVAAKLLETALESDLKNFGKDHPNVADSQSNLALVYHDLGRYEAAAQLLEIALENDLKNFGKDHPTAAARQSNLALVYRDLGRYYEAAKLLETTVERDLKNFGKDHPNVAVSQSILANVFRDLGRYEEAPKLLETALKSTEKNFDKEHPNVAISQSNLANVYRDLGRSEEAAKLLETAVESKLKNFGKDHPTVADSQSNLALVYRDLGRYDAAAQLLETALESSMKNFGRDHPTVTLYQSNLALVYRDLGRYDAAAQLLEIALERDLKNFGKDHPAVAVRQSNLANVYSDLGRYDAAAKLLETALESDLKNFGKDHPNVAVRQSNLANVYSDLGRYEAAAKLLETGLESDLKNFGKDHPNVAVCQSNLANIYSSLGRYDAAAKLLEIALESAEKNFGKDHPTVALYQSNLANIYSFLGRNDAAAKLLETALESDLKNFGKDHPNVAVRQSNLANVYGDLGRYDAAAQLLETALESDLKNFGKDHPNVAVRQSNLAIVYSDLGRNDAAAQLLETALESDLKNFGKDHPNVAIRLNNLAQVCFESKDYLNTKKHWLDCYRILRLSFKEDHPYIEMTKKNLEMIEPLFDRNI